MHGNIDFIHTLGKISRTQNLCHLFACLIRDYRDRQIVFENSKISSEIEDVFDEKDLRSTYPFDILG